jgi:hypothetical protein
LYLNNTYSAYVSKISTLSFPTSLLPLADSNAPSNYVRTARFKQIRWGHTLRLDYAIIGLLIILLAGSMYLAGLSFQIADAPTRVETVTYATYLFVASIVLLIFIIIISIVKKALLKPE